MENAASKTRSLDIAFVADPELLRRLAVVLGEISTALEYTVRFSDGTSVRYTDIKDIITQPNPKRRSIISLIAGAVGHDGQSAYVVLRHDPSPSLEYTVMGPQRNVIYFAEQLDDWAAALRQWYSPFFSSSLGGALALAAIFGPLFVWDTIHRHLPSELANRSKPGSWVALASLVVMYVTEYLIYKLFPRGTFAIGQGAKRHEFFKYVRYGVVGAFVLSVFASVIANWISTHF